MKDLQIKDIKNYLSTENPIRFIWNTGESRTTLIGDFDNYGDYYITKICVRNDELILYIQGEI